MNKDDNDEDAKLDEGKKTRPSVYTKNYRQLSKVRGRRGDPPNTMKRKAICSPVPKQLSMGRTYLGKCILINIYPCKSNY